MAVGIRNKGDPGSPARGRPDTLLILVHARIYDHGIPPDHECSGGMQHGGPSSSGAARELDIASRFAECRMTWR